MNQKTPKTGIKSTKPEVNKVSKKREIVQIDREHKVELVTFSVRATIPTQQYGNIQPEIVVSGPSIEAARDFVMPIIEELYQAYADESLKSPKFFKKNPVTAIEKQIEVSPVVPQKPVPMPAQKEEPEVILPKSEAYIKAEKAIGAAASKEALDLVEEKIKASTRINNDEKPVLYTVILKKRKEIK